MQWSDIRFNPPEKELRQFALLCLVVFGAIGLWRGLRGDWAAAAFFAALALGLGPLGWFLPRALRPIYVGWMVLAFPIGWLVSKLMIALLFFGMITPLALLFRAIGRDPLRRLKRPATASYWEPKPMPHDIRRYFRQY
jgi:hypothetical protein